MQSNQFTLKHQPAAIQEKKPRIQTKSYSGHVLGSTSVRVLYVLLATESTWPCKSGVAWQVIQLKDRSWNISTSHLNTVIEITAAAIKRNKTWLLLVRRRETRMEELGDKGQDVRQRRSTAHFDFTMWKSDESGTHNLFWSILEKTKKISGGAERMDYISVQRAFLG